MQNSSDFSRRALLGLAASRSSEARTAIGSGPFDVAIIGAGAAGIGAAYRLREANKCVSYVILEARGRTGGRAYTDTDCIPGVPVDLGAEWFIQVNPILGSCQTTNPLYDLAAPRARELGVVPDDYPRTFFDPGSAKLSSCERLLPAVTDAAALQASIATYGALTQLGKVPDISAEKTASLAGLHASKWHDFAASPIVNEHGAELSELSTLDLWLTDSVSGVAGDFLIQSGMGKFVESLAAVLPVQLNTPVKSIKWQYSGGVQLETDQGTVQAKTVIVTVPLGVLAGGNPSFDPPLPPEYTDTFAKLPMGVVEKIWLSYSEDVFKTGDKYIDASHNVIAEQLNGTTPAYQFRWFGKNVVAVVVGGNKIKEQAREGRNALIQYARRAVADVFHCDDKFVSATSSEWLKNEYSKGCYTYAIPGGVPARELLRDTNRAKECLAKQIFFAGEAAAVERHGGLPGAWASGQRAAAAVLEVICGS
jgi:monoamine oxidase